MRLLYFLCLSIYSQQFRDASTLSDLDQYYNNNGVSVADYDQDGDLDIFLVSYYSDGNNDLLEIAEMMNINFEQIVQIAETLVNEGLLIKEMDLNEKVTDLIEEIYKEIDFDGLDLPFDDRLDPSEKYPELVSSIRPSVQVYYELGLTSLKLLL